jgi:ABC-type multidrug transport system ATPase subunit
MSLAMCWDLAGGLYILINISFFFLLKTIAGRFDGTIRYNGHPIELEGGLPKDAKYARLIGYVEQRDLHCPYATVKEALQLVVNLKLPQVSDVTKNQSIQSINQTVKSNEY